MTNYNERLDEIPPRFVLYLKARAMRDDDRSMPYIAKKLGFNNASSVDSLLKRYDWFYRWHNKQVEEVLDRLELSMRGKTIVDTAEGWQKFVKRHVVAAIEAERSKLKESSNDQL